MATAEMDFGVAAAGERSMLTKGIVPSIAKITLLLMAVAAIAVGIGFAVDEALSGEPDPVARFDRSPIPYVPSTITPPDTANPAKCKLPDNERPAPDLPTFPCRHELAEPAPGAIPPVSQPPQIRDPGPGRRVIDNAAFRFTIEVLDDWYVNMRPEGGEFYLLDPVALEQDRTSKGLPGGAIIHFSADEYKSLAELGPLQFVPELQMHLEKEPHNAVFGAFTGATWEVPGEEGLARIIRAAFVKDGIVFTIQVNLGLGATSEQTQADVDAALTMIKTIIPY